MSDQPKIVIDISEVHRETRKQWYKTEAPSIGLADRLGAIIPYFIIVVFLVMYGISAPHTATIFNLLTPDLGKLAPIAIELGLIWLAFMRKSASLKTYVNKKGEIKPGRPNVFQTVMRLIIFAVAVLTNFTGALVTVTSNSEKLQNLSISDILGGFGSLPALLQMALIMVFFMAIAVPIIGEQAGHGIANLYYDSRPDTRRDQLWKKAEPTAVYKAVFARYLQSGLDGYDAQQTTIEQVAGYFGQNTQALKGLIASAEKAAQHSNQTLQITAERPLIAASSANIHEQTASSAGLSANVREQSVRTLGNKDDVRAYIRAHKDSEKLSADKLKPELENAAIFAGRTMISEVLKEFRTSANTGMASANEEVQP